MFERRSGWGRFGVFVGANALCLAAIYALVLFPAWEYLHNQRLAIEYRLSRLEQGKAALARNTATSGLLQSRLTGAAARFVQGDDASLLNNDLLTRLRKIAEGRGGVFASLATLPPHEWLGRQLVGARIEFSGTSRMVSDILTDIEDGQCFLFVQKAHFTAAKMDGADETISISLEIYGVTGWPAS
jgi:hypothetical protein